MDIGTGDWSNGMTRVSKTFGGSSILSSPAIDGIRIYGVSRLFYYFTAVGKKSQSTKASAKFKFT